MKTFVSPSFRSFVLTFFLFCISFLGFSPKLSAQNPLSGTYTLGGSNPDFGTLTEAIDSLALRGVSGPVAFDMRTGTFQEQIVIPAISGASATNTITFRSESGDSTDVIVSFGASQSDNYTLKLDGASWLRFERLTLTGTNTTYGRIIEMTNGASHNRFEHVFFQGVNTFSSSSLRTIVYSASTNPGGPRESYNHFSNNYFLDGSYAVYFYGNGGQPGELEVGNTFENNKFESYHYRGLFLLRQDSLRIVGNNFTNVGGSSSQRALYVSSSAGFDIQLNTFNLEKSYGVYLVSCEGDSLNPSLFANNTISMGGTSTFGYGLFATNCSFVNYFHNSVNLYGSGTSNYPLYYNSQGNGEIFLNNIFAYTGVGDGRAFYSFNFNYPDSSDHNDFYTSSSILAFAGADIADMSALRSYSGQEMNSVSGNPLFASPTDLHANKAILDGMGAQGTGVLSDFEGDVRALVPDIGADEFTASGLDVAMTYLEYPQAPFGPGSYTLKAGFTNISSIPVVSAQVYLEINGVVEPVYNWSGSLAQGDSDTLNLGSFTFAENQTYSIRTWVSNPNLMTDIDPTDDSLFVQNISTALIGNYTIGGTNPDFMSLSDAVSSLNGGGIADTVRFMIRSGTYTEQLEITEFVGGGCNGFPVYFQSESGDSTDVTIEASASSSANYTLFLNGADNIIFKHIGFTFTNLSYSRLVELSEGADCNQFLNCQFVGRTVNSTSNRYALIYSGSNFNSANENHNIFRNNRLEEGSYGFFWNGLNMDEKGNVFEKNILTAQYAGAMYFTGQRSIKISFNHINIDSTYGFGYGIQLRSTLDSFSVDHNMINNPGGGSGLLLSSCTGSAGMRGKVYNNFVTVRGSNFLTGLEVAFSDSLDIAFNNVRIENDPSEEGYAFEDRGSNNGDLRVFNNNFVNMGNGIAVTRSSGSVSDYNNFYTVGPVFGFVNGLPVTDFQAYLQASGQDAHSLSTDPLYTSWQDLHVRKGALDSAGLSLAGITTDIDGEPRTSPPDIGADEFTPMGLDAALTYIQVPQAPFTAGTYPVSVVLKNSGAIGLDSATINWSLNGVFQTQVKWYGNLSGRQQDTVVLGNILFADAAFTDVEAWVKQPNGIVDQDASDDSVARFDIIPVLVGTYTVGGINYDFLNMTETFLALQNGGVGDTVNFMLRTGTYAEQVELNNYPGNSCSHPVTFQSESGNAADVLLTFEAMNFQAPHTINLNHVHGLHFRNLTFEGTGEDYAQTVLFEGGCQCLSFENNIFRASMNSSSSTSRSLIFGYGNPNELDSAIYIKQNQFKYGGYGVYYSGNGQHDFTKDIQLKHNSFDEQVSAGIVTYSANNLEILNNQVTSGQSYTYFQGIAVNYLQEGLIVSKNTITRSNGGTGLYIEGVEIDYGVPALISNNFVSLAGGYENFGVYIDYCDSLQFFNNSIWVKLNDPDDSYALYAGYITDVWIKNNFLINSGTGYAFYLYQSSPPESDYNDLFTKGTALGFYNSDVADLTAWQLATQVDSNSVSIDPVYTVFGDLHLIAGFVNDLGTPLMEVPDDIDGESRDPISPDIGADEFSPIGDDVGLLRLVQPQKPFPAGSQDIKVTLFNNGTNVLNSATIESRVDSISLSPFAWTGSLASGDSVQVTIGSFNFVVGNAYEVTAWASQPNGLVDQFASNDTARRDSLYPSLAGYYTVGGANPDFQDLDEAIQVLLLSGVAGEVFFNIRPDTIQGQWRIPAIAGASDSTRITFQAESGDSTDVVLTFNATGSSDNYIIQLDGAGFINFKHLTFLPQNTSYPRQLTFENEAHDVHVDNCAFQNFLRNSSSSLYASVYANSARIHRLEFQNNYFYGSSYGLYLSSTDAVGLKVLNNTFRDHSYASVYAAYHKAPEISQNDFRSTISYIWRGIYLFSCSDQYLISQNQIRGAWGDYGIHLSSCQANPGLPGEVSNNYVEMNSPSSIRIYALYLSNCSYVNVVYNTIRVSTNSSSNRLVYMTNSSGIEMANNIFANMNRGYSIYLFNTTITSSNHNNLYAAINNVGYFNGVRATLADWQTATSQDANSLSLDPLFLTDTTFTPRETSLNGGGTPVSGITVDIEGDPRDMTNPDIGADEFDPVFANDAGITYLTSPQTPFATGNQNIEVVLRNHGLNALTSATVSWQINGINQVNYSWTGNLAATETDTFVLSTFNFQAGQGYDFRAWTSNPNGVQDSLNSNDTTTVLDLYPALAGVYTVGGINPDFTSLDPVIEGLNKGGILSAVTLNIRPGTYVQSFELGSIVGTNASNRVLFQSENGDSSQVVIQTPSGNNTIVLDGAAFLTFRALTVEARQVNRGKAFFLERGASDIIIENCHLAGHSPANYIFAEPVILGYSYSFNQLLENITIRHNLITDGEAGIEMEGYSFSYTQPALEIYGNHLIGQTEFGIRLNDQNAPHINQNRIETDQNPVLFTAIFLDNCLYDYELIGNHIVVAENARGLYLEGTRGSPPQRALVANNYIQIGGSALAHGIETYITSNIDFYFNTIRISSTDPVSSRVWSDASSSSFNFRNNNFVNDGGGYIYYTNTTNSLQTTSHNNLLTTGNILVSRAGVTYPSLVNWRGSTGKDLLSISVDPFFRMLGSPEVRNAMLDSTATVLISVTTDIDGDSRDAVFPDMGADEFLLPPSDVGVIGLVQPPNGCGLSAAEPIEIRIANYGASPQSDFAVAYQIDGGAVVVDTVRASIAPGATADFTFAQTADLSVLRTYQIDAWSILVGDLGPFNDTMLSVTLMHIPNLSQPVGNMLPADGTTGLDIPLTYSWSPSAGASAYDVFVWADSLPQPASPKFTDVSQITVQDNSGLDYGVTYKWQVVAKNGCSTIPGAIQQFTMRTLPDLIVDTVQAPPTAFSGQHVNVSWTIKNEGTFTTGASQWIDAVYLSDDAVFDVLSDTYLGGVGNFSSLIPGQSYASSASLPVPVGIAGNYYLFILTNAYGAVTEADENNNFGTHISAVMISLTPPPDLQVSSIIAPLTAFSGQPINLDFTVTNKGTGMTRSGSWEDWIYLSQDPALNQSTATLLGKRTFSGSLEVDSSYTKSETFTIPQGIFGTYYMHVLTDATDSEFEFVFEANNSTTSDTIGIFLTPPPDLFVNTIETIPDLNSPSTYMLKYSLNNQGGSQVNPSWQDRYYLSLDQVLDVSTDLFLGTKVINTGIMPGDSILITHPVKIPKELTGPYYIFVSTDYRDQVFEYSFENNNVSISNLFQIINPDLIGTAVNHPDTATTGDIIMIDWATKNLGPGDVIGGRWSDQISLSEYPVYDPDSVIEIADVFISATLHPGDSTSRSISVMVPNGLSGDYYVYVKSDKNDGIFEAGQEGNNAGRGQDPIHINLAPWPDLIVRNIQLPDTIRAGDTLPMSFTVVNQGTAATFGSGFTTKAYFQVDSAWNPIQAREIASEDYSMVLAPGDSINYTVDVSMPMLSLVVAGLDSFTVAPVFIEVDVNDEIYEYTDENNNRTRSDSFYIFCPPPVDLVVTQASFPYTNLNSGDPASISWSVQNISSTTAYWNYPFWYDGIFLSRDTIWDGFNDVFVTDWVRPGPLGMNEGYQLSQTFNLLNGLSGAYYVFMVADHTNLNRDGNPDNNAWLIRDNMGQPQVLNVTLSPSPDLQPTLFTAPQNGTAGQPLQVVWEVENRGVGPTLQSSWTDQVYLSTDFVIDPTDTLLGTKVHNGILGINAAYMDSMEVTLPTVNSGNYILLFKTDVNDVLYEHQGEQNNEAFAFIVVYRPPPSDLVVQSIAIPDSVVAGDTATIRWTLKNQGNNPTSGVMTDAVYLSADTIWDVGDALFGLNQQSINLAPQGTTEQSLNQNVSGLPIGDYHVIVRTDILDNIIEQNDTNNLAYSPGKIQLTVEELPLNVLKNNILCDEIELYYRIEIPAGLAGETLLIDLKGDSVNGSNELYLRRGAVPDRVTYDYTSIMPQQSGNQQLVVPSLQAGTYYLMAYGKNAIASKQNVSFLARILNFELRSIMANAGGNTGSVTVRVEGAKFSPTVRLQLEDSGRVYMASSIFYIDPVSVYATFNLRGAALGFYDLVGIQAGDTAVLADAFEIVVGDAGVSTGALSGGGSGSGGSGGSGSSGNFACTVENVGYDNLLVTTITHPATSRLNRIVPITIHYANQGNVDIPTPFRFLISLEGAPLALDVTELNPGFLELILEFSEANGPPGVLRPGATGSVTVYTQATAPLRFRLLR